MRTRIAWFRGKLTLLIAPLVLLLVSQVVAIDLLVYNNNNAGPGSLRQAVNDNNALGGGNTISFSNVVTGTITLTDGELLISKSVTILGPGANVLAVNGNAVSRVFHVTNATVSISGLTVANGRAAGGTSPANFGGGIYNDHSILTLSNCTLSGNSASYGGGIFNNTASGSSTLTVMASTLSGNSATNGGGGISNDGGSVAIIASTLSGNSAGFNGGGINNNGFTTLTISASTVSGNSSGNHGGGIYTVFGPTTISASTVSSNSAPGLGGGVYQSAGTLEIGDTILETGTSGANIFNNSGTVTSRGYNLSSDSGGGFLTGVGDQINSDPQLGPLQANGGLTFTHAPLPGSPAIDQGKTNAVPALALECRPARASPAQRQSRHSQCDARRWQRHRGG